MREYINGVLIPLLNRIIAAPNAGTQMQGAISSALGALSHYAVTHATAPAPSLPPNATRLVNNWLNLALREVESLNIEGNDAICSVTEAHWKTHGIMNWWHQNNRDRFFFRGEHHSNWNLESSAGRNGLNHDPSNLLTVTSGEISALRVFQNRVRADKQLFDSVFPDGCMLPLDSADWWALMQHYNSGTRLIDITSSVFCALFFACADWTGSVDTTVDGAIYLFPEAAWREAVLQPTIIAGQNVGSTDQFHDSVLHYFDLDAHPIIVRFRESLYRNDRLLAQDGYFLWQPQFDNRLNLRQIFKFRVPAARKIHVLRELYSIGYTAKRLIRGTQGDNAHLIVCRTIGVTA
jgi:hypothetical protein